MRDYGHEGRRQAEADGQEEGAALAEGEARRQEGRGEDRPARALSRELDVNVVGGELLPCSEEPLTGFFRNGCCSTGPEDLGSHTVCAVMTGEFLEFSRLAGNDLSTPRPEWGFAGLQAGDRWCVCADRWLEAHRAGCAPPVVLGATHARALDVVPIETLTAYAQAAEPA